MARLRFTPERIQQILEQIAEPGEKMIKKQIWDYMKRDRPGGFISWFMDPSIRVTIDGAELYVKTAFGRDYIIKKHLDVLKKLSITIVVLGEKKDNERVETFTAEEILERQK